MMQEEATLIRDCLRGDRKQQHTLYNRYRAKMWVVCLRYTKTRADAEDVLQEAFIKVFHSLAHFRQDCPLEAWIKRIVVNTALKHLRGKLYASPPEDLQQHENLLPESEFTLSNYQFSELLAMIQKLPLRCQTVFNLYAIEGYQHQEIAELLEISEGTSKSQYARAKTLLQQMIQAEEVKYVSRVA